MFSNYFITALRNAGRDKLFSLINIIGLATGFAASLLIFLFISHEIGFDSWVEDSERIFRVEGTFHPLGRDPVPANTVSGPVRAALEANFPSEIESATRIFQTQQSVLRKGEAFQETINFVDEDFFRIFSFGFLQGDVAGALRDSRSLVVTAEMAKKYFGERQPIGEVLTLVMPQGRIDFRISAVIENLPQDTHLAGEFYALIDEEFWAQVFPNLFTNWINISSFTYVKLPPGADPAGLEARLPDFADKYNFKPSATSYANVMPRDFVHLNLRNLRDIHLYSEGPGDMQPAGSIATVYAFAGIALLLIGIASINFVNLATARAARRAKEVALRKTLGAGRLQLIVQFLGESFLMVGIAAVVAVASVELALPWYNEMLGTSFSTEMFMTAKGVAGLLALCAAVAITSGIYPAFYLSQVQPGHVLHSNQSSTSGSGRVREVLVTFQFTVSIALIAATIILYWQSDYVRGLDLGYEGENITVLRITSSTDFHGDAERLREELQRVDGVESVGLSGNVPTDVQISSAAILSPMIPGDESTSIRQITAGYGFFQTFGIEPVAGRLISEEYGTDQLPVFTFREREASGSVILNESAVRRLGFRNPEHALGQTLRTPVSTNIPTFEVTIVGVVPDFHFESAREAIQPLLFWYVPRGIGTVSVRSHPAMHDAVQSRIEEIWRTVKPDVPLQRDFMTDLIDAQYEYEQQQGRLLTAFSVLTILVACLGLLGLSAFIAERRTKEVGIRKVMGASTHDIVRLFVWSFSKPMFAANLIAWPLAWYFMGGWLDGFVYRIDLDPLPFVAAGVIAAVFGAVTVASRTFGAARARPINALRCE